MKRTVEQWKNSNPKAMAEQSQAALWFAFGDARADIMELAHENKLMREILIKIAYPSRETEESTATILDAAKWIQDRWTLEELNR